MTSRPSLTTGVPGHECPGCGFRTTLDGHRRCPDCGGRLRGASFAGCGSVWSWTVVHPADQPPYGLAYVDLDGGPRLLARFDKERSAVHCGTRVEIEQADGIFQVTTAVHTGGGV